MPFILVYINYQDKLGLTGYSDSRFLEVKYMPLTNLLLISSELSKHFSYALRNAPACVLSHFSRVSVTQWNVFHQSPQTKGFSRQEYWSGLPCPSPGDLP